jgi:hypothetical protein
MSYLSTCHYRWNRTAANIAGAAQPAWISARLLLCWPLCAGCAALHFYLTIELKGNPHRSARTNRQPGVRLR